MPLYPYRCNVCGKQDDFLLDYDHSPPTCCEESMDRIFTPFSFSVDFKPGWDDGAGQYFDTKRQRENWVAKNNLRRIRS